MTYVELTDSWNAGIEFLEAYTSGSTGKPKKINLPRRFVEESAKRTNEFFSINSDSRLHSCISPDFIGGKMMAVRASLAGCRLTWEEPSNSPLGNLLQSERISLLSVVPSQMIHIIDRADSLPQIDAIIVGGGAMDPELCKKAAASGLSVFETYGMTETSSHIAIRNISRNETVFTVMPGITVCSDNRGCLVIMFEEWDDVVTNDICTVYDSFHFTINGRYDHVIVSGGRKINPFDVEQRIAGFLNSDFVITSAPDEKWGSRVVLLIEEGNCQFDIGKLLERMSEVLERWEIPKDIKVVKSLKRTENGKILREQAKIRRFV